MAEKLVPFIVLMFGILLNTTQLANIELKNLFFVKSKVSGILFKKEQLLNILEEPFVVVEL
jgi:hypothetical protein